MILSHQAMIPVTQKANPGAAQRRLWTRIGIPYLTGLVGMAAGWWLKPAVPESPAGVVGRTAPFLHADQAHAAKETSPGTLSRAGASLEEEIPRMVREAEKLSPSAFGERLAELLAKPPFGNILVERGIMSSLLNGERMEATYAIYKRRTGAGPTHDTRELREFLLVAAQKDGKQTMERLLTLHPDGFAEMGSVAYGWALSNPPEAVDWLNSLPEESESRKKSLRGLMSGLTANNGDLGGKVMASLAQEDRPAAAAGFANSMIQNHGIEQFDRWLDTADPELATLAIEQSSFRAGQQEPAQYVAWLARHAGIVPPDQLSAAFRNWIHRDPSAAAAWLRAQPGSDWAAKMREEQQQTPR